MRKHSRKLAALAAFIIAIGTLGVAYAYWTSTGSGSGSASTKSAITVSLSGTAVTNLVPGAAQDINGTVTASDSATSAYVGTITPSIDGANTTWNGTCSAADFQLTSNTLNAQVPTGATRKFGTIALKDTNANKDDCKSQTVALSFSSN